MSALLRGSVVVLGALLWAVPAGAQPAPGPAPSASAEPASPAPPSSSTDGAAPDASSDRGRALELGREGMALFEARQWADAYDRFSRADRLVHSPVFLLYMARAERNWGHNVAAFGHYERLVSAQLSAQDPEPWHQAQRDGASELGELRQRVPSLRILAHGAAVGSMTVWLDGARIDPPPVEAAVAVEPGSHVLVVRRGAWAEERRTVLVREGGGETVVDLSIPAASGPGAGDLASSQPSGAQGSTSPVSTAGIVLLSAGGLGLVTWMITGSVALELNSELKQVCSDGVCDAANQSKVDTYDAVGNAATGTLIAGALLAVTGTILLIAAPADRGPNPSPVTARLTCGPGSLAIVGTF